MEYLNKITRDDAIFFMDMIDSSKSPNHVSKKYKVKPFRKLLKDRNSGDYKRFIELYEKMRHILSETEQVVLDEIYGVSKEPSTLLQVSNKLNKSPERARQICVQAQFRLARALVKKLKDENNKNTTAL
jgi:DNA-directed RNA polymerase sigma subunit (sigma70/sigma32)